MTESTGQGAEAERPALTRRRILDAALALADAEGLEALSMRRLGAALGVEAMSLYHHFPGKPALLDGLVATVLGEVPLPEATPTGWEDAVRRGFTAFRQVLLAHPALFPLLATRPPTQRESLAAAARAFAILAAVGFEPHEAASAWTTLLAFTFGFVQCEISGVGETTRGAAMLSLVEELRGPDFAAFRTTHSTIEDWDGDVEFARGLDVLISGLRARLHDATG
ncbi:MAG: TetR/AcrR family transcriptional regulator C-terminal domain-containing protein [Candidatus Dormibacteria bacterium]